MSILHTRNVIFLALSVQEAARVTAEETLLEFIYLFTYLGTYLFIVLAMSFGFRQRSVNFDSLHFWHNIMCSATQEYAGMFVQNYGMVCVGRNL